MALKDILVVLDETPRSDVRLSVALDLAREHDAHLIGLCPFDLMLPATTGLELAGFAKSAVLEFVARMRTEARDRASPIETRFRNELQKNDLKGEWRLAEGRVGELVACQAHSSDLVVLGQNDPHDPLPLEGRRLVEQVLLGSGRPVLVIPYAGQFASIGRRVLIGWNASREAARAVHDALPLIRPDAAVTVLSVAADGPEEPAQLPSSDIAAHLARYGLSVTITNTARGKLREEELLLNHASDMSADMIVIGGYGHSRLRELVLGGVTRSLLRSMIVPVLMSH